MILQMVADKKITPSEGVALLQALEGDEEPSGGTSAPPRTGQRSGQSGGLGSSLTNLIEETVERVAGVLSELKGQQYQFPTEITGVFTVDEVPLRIFSGNGPVELRSWDEPGYKAQIVSKTRASNQAEAQRQAQEACRVTATETGFQLETDRGFANALSDVEVHLTLFLPRDRVYHLETSTGNGPIRIEGLRLSEGSARTGNGRITVRNVIADRLYLKSGNGSIEVDADVADLEASTGNGSLRVIPTGRRSEQMQLKTGNGSATIDTGRLSRDTGLYIDAHTGMGSVSISRSGLVYELDERNIGYKHVIAHTEGFDTAEPKVSLRVRTGFGSITVE